MGEVRLKSERFGNRPEEGGIKPTKVQKMFGTPKAEIRERKVSIIQPEVEKKEEIPLYRKVFGTKIEKPEVIETEKKPGLYEKIKKSIEERKIKKEEEENRRKESEKYIRERLTEAKIKGMEEKVRKKTSGEDILEKILIKELISRKKEKQKEKMSGFAPARIEKQRPLTIQKYRKIEPRVEKLSSGFMGFGEFSSVRKAPDTTFRPSNKSQATQPKVSQKEVRYTEKPSTILGLDDFSGVSRAPDVGLGGGKKFDLPRASGKALDMNIGVGRGLDLRFGLGNIKNPVVDMFGSGRSPIQSKKKKTQSGFGTEGYF